MTRKYLAVIALLPGSIFGQSADAPSRFEIADVHVSAKTLNAFVRMSPPRGGRYEIRNATMLDLVRIASGFDTDRILGGPNWLELDRFDVIAKMPAGSTADAQKQMLQALLEDRFRLAVHKDTRPLPTWVLIAGGKHKLKEAAGSEETGCKLQTASGSPGEGNMRMMSRNPNGTTTAINIGPGMTVQYLCRNMTTAAFAEGLRGMMGTNLGPNAVLDQTGLKGNWNFDFRYSLQNAIALLSGEGDRITVSDAVEKQLGLKLEERQIPKPVIVVDSVNRKPGDNPPGVAEALPSPPVPTEFEVADVKLADPDIRAARFQTLPGGRFVSQGMPMRFLISRAFNVSNGDQIVGLPKWVDTDRFDITAKAPSEGGTVAPTDQEALPTMLRALLAVRFRMTYHMEERTLPAYSLVAAKPKMKKADPASRISCRNGNAAPSAPAGSRALVCQNITMAQFAERLQNLAPGLNSPVQDATGIEGGWDFTLTFNPFPAMLNGPARGGDSGQAGVLPSAADPGGGYTIFEAVEKQLGLKLDPQKRPMQVIVIDHLEQKPTDN